MNKNAVLDRTTETLWRWTAVHVVSRPEEYQLKSFGFGHFPVPVQFWQKMWDGRSEAKYVLRSTGTGKLTAHNELIY